MKAWKLDEYLRQVSNEIHQLRQAVLPLRDLSIVSSREVSLWRGPELLSKSPSLDSFDPEVHPRENRPDKGAQPLMIGMSSGASLRVIRRADILGFQVLQ